MNQSIIGKLRESEKELSRIYGPLRLFGVFYREESNKWPLVVSADWFGSSELDNLRKINDVLQKHLSLEEIVTLGWTYAVPPDDPAVRELNQNIRTQGEDLTLQNFIFRGADIVTAIIITSQETTPALVAA